MFFRDLLSGLDETPSFRFFGFKDVNPVSGREKRRILGAPNGAMRTLQGRFVKILRSNENMEVRGRFLRYATSCNPGDSSLENARRHRRSQHFYLVDFTNAYRSVDARRLAEVLIELPTFREIPVGELSTFLQTYFFHATLGLVQGGNASPDLFNLYAGALVDVPLRSILEKSGITYTRYLDDLTFSSVKLLPRKLRKRLREPILQAGFLISHRKCERIDLEKKTVRITGYGIADGGRLFVPRPYARKVRGALHRARTKGDVSMRSVTGMVQSMRQLAEDQDPNSFEGRVLEEYYALRNGK